jgi:hypothetical protein
MGEAKDIENSQGKTSDDLKAKMLFALTKKQKGHNTGKSAGPTSGSKVGAGQTTSVAPKIHRRKAGSA